MTDAAAIRPQDRASTPRPRRLPQGLLKWVGVAPFLIFAALFLILPTLNIVVGAF